MKCNKLISHHIPERLQAIAQPPRELYCTLAAKELQDILSRPCVAIVGARRLTIYGQQVTADLACRLAQAGVVIISGLAYGVDATAHQAALSAGGTTIAVLPSPLDQIYPARNQNLAADIVKLGGALLSEYVSGRAINNGNFIARNRLIAGLSQAVVITEAAERSGSLHTANFALEQGKEVLAVPGNITSTLSTGTNNLIKAGATPVSSYIDVLHALGLEPETTVRRESVACTPQEQAILQYLQAGVTDGEELQAKSQLSVTAFNQALTMLELSGAIRALGANHWTTT